jgi:hypothetical protein
MVKQKISAEALRELLDYNADTGEFTRRVRTSNAIQVGDKAGSLQQDNGYVRINLCGTRYYAHQLAWIYSFGSIPDGMIVDHKNRIRSDNRILNLRLVNSKESAENRGPSSSGKTGVKGVSWRRTHSKYVAQITHHRKNHFIGYFDTIEEAHEAYKHAAAQLHTHNPSAAPDSHA